ncbi:MAG: hypothetical protein HN981_03010 [Candidatus Pacebacteria bacterium]|jgi:hypothetical protein|nr:hypothetical protein [Candidatus Paceibacterota bacterium]MBT4652811.1 hypothetical protein [Candidatus Paceibacterota bacterium]MBT6756601.1 hypothetical protein [Candidatus Paceibacterota bacterium]MBT6921337.1 hypothetical protein [Candidatus Paceibacterota bacterium]
MTQENTPQPPTKPELSISQEKDFLEFIEDREIASEDIKILTDLSEFPKELLALAQIKI